MQFSSFNYIFIEDIPPEVPSSSLWRVLSPGFCPDQTTSWGQRPIQDEVVLAPCSKTTGLVCTVTARPPYEGTCLKLEIGAGRTGRCRRNGREWVGIERRAEITMGENHSEYLSSRPSWSTAVLTVENCRCRTAWRFLVVGRNLSGCTDNLHASRFQIVLAPGESGPTPTALHRPIQYPCTHTLGGASSAEAASNRLRHALTSSKEEALIWCRKAMCCRLCKGVSLLDFAWNMAACFTPTRDTRWVGRAMREPAGIPHSCLKVGPAQVVWRAQRHMHLQGSGLCPDTGPVQCQPHSLRRRRREDE